MTDRLLIIDDDTTCIRQTVQLLENVGFEVFSAQNGEEGLRTAYRHQPDLVLLAIEMPLLDGWEVCRRLRNMSDVPIVFLSQTHNIGQIVRGLEIGADDVVVKPYNPEELVARVRAHLRRAPRPRLGEELVLDNGAFCINFMNREVRVRGDIKHLTPKEFNLLSVLVRNAGRVVPRDELVADAWGEDFKVAVDSLKLYIHYLRHKIERNPERPDYIITSRGIGYRFMGQ